jgi:hypothetical protein
MFVMYTVSIYVCNEENKDVERKNEHDVSSITEMFYKKKNIIINNVAKHTTPEYCIPIAIAIAIAIAIGQQQQQQQQQQPR